MNFNTFACYRSDYPSGHPSQLASQTLAATTETAVKFANGNAAIIAVPSQTAVLGSSSPMDPNANSAISADVYGAPSDRRGLAQRPYFNSTSFDFDRPFIFRICGRGTAVANGANTWTLNIYQGTASTVVGTSGNLVATSGTVTMATAEPFGFYMDVKMAWDAVNQALYGVFSGAVLYNSATVTTVANTALSHNTAVTTYAGLSFLASVTWGNAVGGTTTVTEMALEQV